MSLSSIQSRDGCRRDLKILIDHAARHADGANQSAFGVLHGHTARKDDQPALEEMGRAVAAAEATHERRAAEQRAEIEALTREVAARRQSLQEVNEQIAALSRR